MVSVKSMFKGIFCNILGTGHAATFEPKSTATVAQAAEIAGCSPGAIRHRIKNGELVPVGRDPILIAVDDLARVRVRKRRPQARAKGQLAEIEAAGNSANLIGIPGGAKRLTGPQCRRPPTF